jgi:hypothetical protein
MTYRQKAATYFSLPGGGAALPLEVDGLAVADPTLPAEGGALPGVAR